MTNIPTDCPELDYYIFMVEQSGAFRMYGIALLWLSSTVYATTNCPTGATQGISDNACYIYKLRPLQWFEAEVDCGNHDGTLTSIHNAFENTFLMQPMKGICYTEFWLGAAAEVGKWMWTDGSRFTYTNWAKGIDGSCWPMSNISKVS